MEDPSASTPAPSTTRKRPRPSTSPLVRGNNTPPPRQFSESEWLAALKGSDSNAMKSVLNEMLQVSYSHEINYALSSDALLHALVHVAWQCLSWPPPPGVKITTSSLINKENIVTDQSTVTVTNENNNIHYSRNGPLLFSSYQSWYEHPTHEMKVWMHHGKEQLRLMSEPDTQLLEVILSILRNWSFVSANLRWLLYTPSVIQLLLVCLYDAPSTFVGSSRVRSGGTASTLASSDGSSIPEGRLAAAALTTLIHLAPLWDVSGQRWAIDQLFTTSSASSSTTTSSTTTVHTASLTEAYQVPRPQPSWTLSKAWGMGGIWMAKKLDVKEDTLNEVSPACILELTHTYLVAVWSLFPALFHILTSTQTPRSVLLLALDLLQELINNARIGVIGSVTPEDPPDSLPSLRAILVHMPDSLVERLVDCLYIPRLGPDALEYLDPIHNVVTRVTTLKLLAGYDNSLDTDVRDRVLEVWVPLLELDSPALARRVGTQPAYSSSSLRNTTVPRRVPRLRLWEALVPIVTTTSGRNDASTLAMHMIRELIRAPENQTGFSTIQGRLIAMASQDQRVAHWLWNHVTAGEVLHPDETEHAPDHTVEE
jgi:hypothetical protein